MPDRDLLGAIVLAAGVGRRLGREKALLDWGGRPLVAHVVSQFPRAVVRHVALVANAANQQGIASCVPADVRVVVNPDPAGDMLSSVRCGLDALEAAGGSVARGAICVHPVDCFALTAALVNLLHEAWRRETALIHVPVVNGKRGHPVIIPVELAAGIRALPPGTGLNGLLRGRPQLVREHAWTDEKLLCDIDTPEDYERNRPGQIPG